AGYTHTPAAAFLLVNQDNPVLFALINRARWTRCHTGRIQAVLAEARQIHHESIFIFAINLFLNPLKVVILRALRKLTTKDFLPVGSPFNFFHTLARDYRAWASSGEMG